MIEIMRRIISHQLDSLSYIGMGAFRLFAFLMSFCIMTADAFGYYNVGAFWRKPTAAAPSGSLNYDEWTWVSGSNSRDQAGTYGTKGTASSSNIPGGRVSSVSWVDSSNIFWLFGGYGYDSVGSFGVLNDLWKWDGTNWTWVSGSDTISSAGSYGTKGVAASSNVPPARYYAGSWIDSSNNLWLFGGMRIGARYNDLWKWDGTNWTWVSGSSATGQSGTYGTKGTPAAGNVPGARNSPTTWRDSANVLWLFGGNALDSVASTGNINDLWKWDGTNWTWVSGANTVLQTGNYGTKGTPSSSNVPGARSDSIAWRDSSNNLWLFGGSGRDSTGTDGSLNDLWKWNGTNWTWISGSNVGNQGGVYGTMGVASASNVPGARYSAMSWTDTSSTFWLFGGNGYDSSASGFLGDLWKWDGTNWTWVSGGSVRNQLGTYGTQGSPATTNIPGARSGANTWIDSSNRLWLFGGNGYDTSGSGILNDLWNASEGIYSISSSTISGTGPTVADGVAVSTITITLKKKDGTGAPGVTPTFFATNTGGTNSLGACSVTDSSGVSTCTLKSYTAETKTLSITGPISKTGGTVDFVAGGAAKLAFSTQPEAQYVNVDFSTLPSVVVQDAYGNIISNATNSITLSASTLSDCSNVATGTLTATTNPVSAVSGVANFAGVRYTDTAQIYLKASAAGLTAGCSNLVRFRKTISFVAAATATTGGAGTSLSVNVPAGTATGDVMIAMFVTAADVSVTPPSGWNLVVNYFINGGNRERFYWRAASSEPASYSWSFTSAQANGVILTYHNVDASAPIPTYDYIGGQTATGINLLSRSLTAPEIDSFLVLGFHNNGAATLTLPAGTTSRANFSSTGNPSSTRVRTGVSDKALSSAGATGDQNATPSATGGYWTSVGILLKRGYY